MMKVILAGPRGKLGREALHMILENKEFELVACIDRVDTYEKNHSAPLFTDAESCFKEVKADVLIELTNHESAKKHLALAIEHGVSCVVGTTGWGESELQSFQEQTEQKGIGMIIAPNFSIGAILMMRFSQMAAKYYQDVEIMELHHDQKLDAPSGTAVKTAQMISEVRKAKKQGHKDEKETIVGARGADLEGMRIHSVRLPGLIAHQQVMFGATGEGLTIRHDTYDRKSFAKGIELAVKHVGEKKEFIYGLEQLID